MSESQAGQNACLSNVISQYSDKPELLPISAIDLYPARDIRCSLNEQAIVALAKLDDFDPVRVVRTPEGKLHMSDGCHRTKAKVRRGEHYINAFLADGSAEDAFRHSCIINDRHGQGTTETDKRYRVLRAMERWPGMSTYWYAETCGCSQTYVVLLKEEIDTSKQESDRKIAALNEKKRDLQLNSTTHTEVARTAPPKIKVNKVKAKDGRFFTPKTAVKKALDEALAYPEYAELGPYKLAKIINIDGKTISSYLKARAKASGESSGEEAAPIPAQPNRPRRFRLDPIEATDPAGLGVAVARSLVAQMSGEEFREFAIAVASQAGLSVDRASGAA